jgi:hypothetical protein
MQKWQMAENGCWFASGEEGEEIVTPHEKKKFYFTKY